MIIISVLIISLWVDFNNVLYYENILNIFLFILGNKFYVACVVFQFPPTSCMNEVEEKNKSDHLVYIVKANLPELNQEF